MNDLSQSKTDFIPVIDIGDYLAGDADARDVIASELRHAMENVGFYILDNHGVSIEQIEATLEAVKRFHAQPLEAKMALLGNEHNIGYMAVNTSRSRASQVDADAVTKPNFVEAFFVKRDLPSDHSDVVAGKLYRPANMWPENLPGFRETILAYCRTMEALCQRMLPLYALALDLPADYFEEPFAEATYSFRMSHYPPAELGEKDQFGVSAHTDSSFLTMLPQGDLPGLEVKLPGHGWRLVKAPHGSIVVNSGDLMRRWTNHRFLSTPHRAINNNPGKNRYAIPFFFDAHVDYPMSCLPTCQGSENPARYEAITYTDYMKWFSRKNYDHVRDKAGTEADDPGVPRTQSVRD